MVIDFFNVITRSSFITSGFWFNFWFLRIATALSETARFKRARDVWIPSPSPIKTTTLSIYIWQMRWSKISEFIRSYIVKRMSAKAFYFFSNSKLTSKKLFYIEIIFTIVLVEDFYVHCTWYAHAILWFIKVLGKTENYFNNFLN